MKIEILKDGQKLISFPFPEPKKIFSYSINENSNKLKKFRTKFHLQLDKKTFLIKWCQLPILFTGKLSLLYTAN